MNSYVISKKWLELLYTLIEEWIFFFACLSVSKVHSGTCSLPSSIGLIYKTCNVLHLVEKIKYPLCTRIHAIKEAIMIASCLRNPRNAMRVSYSLEIGALRWLTESYRYVVSLALDTWLIGFHSRSRHSFPNCTLYEPATDRFSRSRTTRVHLSFRDNTSIFFVDIFR